MHTVLLTLTCNPGVRDGFLPVFAEALARHAQICWLSTCRGIHRPGQLKHDSRMGEVGVARASGEVHAMAYGDRNVGHARTSAF